jgi:diadenosine tetraphosphate (Ap4A) HIT family hydrolase
MSPRAKADRRNLNVCAAKSEGTHIEIVSREAAKTRRRLRLVSFASSRLRVNNGCDRVGAKMTCVFCHEPRDSGELISEVRGHAMIVWRKHVENVADLTPNEYAHFASVHHRVEKALLDITRADRAILLKLGIATPHLHLHIYPVSASLDRARVMEIIDGKTVDAMSDEQRKTFIEELRQRLA